MPRHLILTAAAVSIAASLAVATPASAAVGSLPAQDRLFQVGCNDAPGAVLSALDPDTLVTTIISTAAVPDACAAQGSVDPTTGLGYWISWVGADSFLAVTDLETGEATTIGELTESGTGDILGAQSLAIDDAGNAYLMGQNRTDSTAQSQLYSLDLTTAQATLIGTLMWGPQEAQAWYAFAYRPTDGQFYGVASSGSVDAIGVFRVDVTDATIELLVGYDDLPALIYSFAFDSDGAVWGLGADNTTHDWVLFSSSVSDFAGDYAVRGEPTLDGEPYFSESLLLARGEAPPAPQLAATGAGMASAAPLALVALAALLLGAIAWGSARGRRA
ncbi:hypothetical protein [Schumannella luteola]